MKKFVAILISMFLLFALVACGGNQDPTKTDEPTETGEPTEAGNDKLKVALVLPGSLNDGGWNANAYAGLKVLEEEGYQVAFTESVEISAIEEAFRNYAAAEYDLVIGHGFEFGEPAMRVAPEFKNVNFFVSGKMPDGVKAEDLPSNVGFMDMKEYEAAYLAGIVAGGMTESNVIGYVAGLEIPPQLSNMAAFVNGVKVSNPEAKIYGVIAGTFEDPAKGQEAANAQIDMGADLICQTADSTGMGAIQACIEKDINIIGYGADQYEIAPELMITSIVTDNKNAVIQQAERIQDGTFGGLWEPGVAEGVCFITPFHDFEDKIPQDIKDLVDQARKDIESGDLEIPYILERIDNKLE